jgi:hypothetical protein
MNLKEVLSISGMPGLYKMLTNRDNGLIVVALGDDKKKFVSSRQHMFTPLENITIYTESEPVELTEVFLRMKKNAASIAVESSNASSDKLRSYFTQIVPDHDVEKVYVSDIKKIIKWFELLDKEGLVVEAQPEAEGAEEEKKSKAEKKPKAAAKTKTPAASEAKPKKEASAKQTTTRQKK